MRPLLLAVLLAAHASQAAPPDADSVRLAYQNGESALQKGDLPLAEESFRSVIRMVPDDVGARVNLAVVFMREKRWRQALQFLKEAEGRAPAVTGIRLNIGLAEYQQGDYAEAIPPFQSVLRDQPDSVQARRLLGLCYLFCQRYPESAATLEPLWTASHADLSYLYSLAVAAGNAGQHDLENRALARLMEIGKDSPLVHLLQGKAYLAREDFGHALDELRTAEIADPKLPLVHYNLGVVYRRQARLDEAREEFLADMAIEPAIAFNYDQLGEIGYRLQQYETAESYFRHAVALDPKLGTSWFGLAKIFKQQKHFTEALKALDRAGALDPDSASVHYLRGQILTELGRASEASSELALVRRLKLQSLDKLEKEVNGPSYHDPEIRDQPAP